MVYLSGACSCKQMYKYSTKFAVNQEAGGKATFFINYFFYFLMHSHGSYVAVELNTGTEKAKLSFC